MTHCSIEPRTRKCIGEFGFLLFARNVSEKYGKKIIGSAIKQDKMLQKLLLKR